MGNKSRKIEKRIPIESSNFGGKDEMIQQKHQLTSTQEFNFFLEFFSASTFANEATTAGAGDDHPSKQL